MSITEALLTAARLLGTTIQAMAFDAQVRGDLYVVLECVEKADRILATQGLRLAVVPTEHPPIDIPDRHILAAAEQYHIARGEPQVRHRLARLLRIEHATLVRTLSGGKPLGGTDRGETARKRLWDHQLNREAHPLPAPIRRAEPVQLATVASCEPRPDGGEE